MRFFDLHCDTPYECYSKKLDFSSNELAVSPQRGSAFSEWKQCFAIWIRDDMPNPFDFYLSVKNDFLCKVSCCSKVQPILTVEGGAVLEQDISRLETLRSHGVRMLTLTWNGKNRIASGANAFGGLSDFGRDVVLMLNRLHMACDLSHINTQGFYAAAEAAAYPIATHSCCRSACEHPRNLDDSQLKLISEKGGIVGLCLYPEFLGDGDVYENVYRHICHMLDLGLEKNVSIGSDFDGATMDKKLNNISKIPDLYAYLADKGLGIDLLDKIFYTNADNFVSRL